MVSTLSPAGWMFICIPAGTGSQAGSGSRHTGPARWVNGKRRFCSARHECDALPCRTRRDPALYYAPGPALTLASLVSCVALPFVLWRPWFHVFGLSCYCDILGSMHASDTGAPAGLPASGLLGMFGSVHAADTGPPAGLLASGLSGLCTRHAHLNGMICLKKSIQQFMHCLSWWCATAPQPCMAWLPSKLIPTPCCVGCILNLHNYANLGMYANAWLCDLACFMLPITSITFSKDAALFVARLPPVEPLNGCSL